MQRPYNNDGKVIHAVQPHVQIFTTVQDSHLVELLDEISRCRAKINGILREVQSSDEIAGRSHSFLNVLGIFEIEILSELESWERTAKAIEVYLVKCHMMAHFLLFSGGRFAGWPAA